MDYLIIMTKECGSHFGVDQRIGSRVILRETMFLLVIVGGSWAFLDIVQF